MVSEDMQVANMTEEYAECRKRWKQMICCGAVVTHNGLSRKTEKNILL